MRVGIFWFVDNIIIGDTVSLDVAEEYGVALQHGSHYEFWTKLFPKTEVERKLKAREYDYYPRGRMVFFPERKTFRLYVDPCLDNECLKETLHFFAAADCEVEIEDDEHYRCASCNPRYVE